MSRTWLITGASSGFGYEIARQLLERGDRVVGTVRNVKKIEKLLELYPDRFFYQQLDVTDVDQVKKVIQDAFSEQGKIDVLVSNAGYGLYGAAEEFSKEEIEHVIKTNLTGSIAVIQSALPFFRKQKSGRIIQVSSVAGQVGYLGNSLYNATKFGIEGYCEALTLEMAPFHVGVTIVEPGGARTDFRYGGAKVAANLIPEYEHAHGFLEMLNPRKGLAPGDPVAMASRMIESVDIEPAPLHMVLGSKALEQTIDALSKRLDSFKNQKELAASTDIVERF